jgi:hypothetical protein
VGHLFVPPVKRGIMIYSRIEPPGEGELGRMAVVDFSIRPPIIHRAHFSIFYRPDSELILTSPCFLVTRNLKESIIEHGFTGVRFQPCELSKGAQYDELSDPDTDLPEMEMLIPQGVHGIDDICYCSNTCFLRPNEL